MATEILVPQTLTDTGGLLTSSAVASIDETCDSLDNTYNTTDLNDQTGVTAASWTLTDISSFGEVSSVTFRVNASVQSVSNDTSTYRLRLNVGGSTYDINFTESDTAYSTKTITVGTGFTEAQYNAATVELAHTAWSKSAGFDDLYLSIDAIDLVVVMADVENITSDFDTLTSTPYDGDINDKTEVSSGFDSLNAISYDASVELKQAVSSDFDSVTLTKYDALINDKTEVVSSLAELSITSYNSGAGLKTNIVSDFDVFTIVSYDSIISRLFGVVSNFDTMSVTPYAGTIEYTLGITSNYVELSLTRYQGQVKNIYKGVFRVSGGLTFNGQWTAKEI